MNNLYCGSWDQCLSITYCQVSTGISQKPYQYFTVHWFLWKLFLVVYKFTCTALRKLHRNITCISVIKFSSIYVKLITLKHIKNIYSVLIFFQEDALNLFYAILFYTIWQGITWSVKAILDYDCSVNSQLQLMTLYQNTPDLG